MLRFVLFSICLIFACAASGAAQENCLLSANNAPSLFNLKLGDTPEQTRGNLNRKFKIKNKRKGEYTFFQNYIKDAPPVFLPGIRAFYLRFYEGKLYQIEFFYEEKNRFKTLETFIALQSINLQVPPPLWKTAFGIARIDCGGFTIEADNVLNPRIELTDEVIRAEVEAKREKDG